MIFLVRLGDGTDRKRVVMATYLSNRIDWSRFACSSRRIGKVKTKENADELFIYLINDPNPEIEWNFGVFIVHMEGMREQLRGRDFEEHKNWVFNTHPDKVPSFKELMRAVLIALVR